jgi:hypothetical protein
MDWLTRVNGLSHVFVVESLLEKSFDVVGFFDNLKTRGYS